MSRVKLVSDQTQAAPGTTPIRKDNRSISRIVMALRQTPLGSSWEYWGQYLGVWRGYTYAVTGIVPIGNLLLFTGSYFVGVLTDLICVWALCLYSIGRDRGLKSITTGLNRAKRITEVAIGICYGLCLANLLVVIF